MAILSMCTHVRRQLMFVYIFAAHANDVTNCWLLGSNSKLVVTRWSHGSPLSAQLSSKSVCTTRNFSLEHANLSPTEYTEHAIFNREWAWSSRTWAWHQKFARALRAFFILATPIPKFLDPPLLHNVIYMPLWIWMEHGVNYWTAVINSPGRNYSP